MVWRLRFYDDSGVEIGYVEKPDRDTYSVFVTHPSSGWSDFESRLQRRERLILDAPDIETDTTYGVRDTGPMLDRLPPEAHLQEIQTEFSHPDVADSSLDDE